MPFDFLRRRKPPSGGGDQGSRPSGGKGGGTTTFRFDGLTEEWRLLGTMHVEGRLSDLLNRREAVPISDVSWAPIDGSGQLTAVPGLKSVDPYDLILVLAPPDSKPAMSETEKAAYVTHKVSYDVAIEAPPFRVVGTIFLLPGTEPASLLNRGTEMFVPVVDAVASLGDKPVSHGEIDSILVNRFYMRGIEQIDLRTGERPLPLPGQPLGGTSWQDKAR